MVRNLVENNNHIFNAMNYIITTLLFLFAVSCEQNNHVQTYRLPKKIKTQDITVNNKNDSTSLIWDVPISWEKFDGHAMRLASYYVPFPNGKGELSISIFPGSSGGITANINRWRKQIALSEQNQKEILDSAENLTSKIGNFTFHQLVNDESGDAILASIFQLRDQAIFIKLVIMSDGVMNILDDFKTFCSSLEFSTVK